MTPSDKTDLQVSEEQDGSALVQMSAVEAPEGDEKHLSSANDRDDRDDDDDDGSVDPERVALREARREERRLKKQISREKTKESNQLINVLKRQNEQMAERLAVLEKRTAGADVARLDKAIEDSQLRVQYAKMKIAEAAKIGDGQGVADAQEAWYDAKRNFESLEALKKRSSAEPTSASVPKAPDPRLQRHAGDWMARNDWYDPNGKDTDSKIAVKVDEELVEEGWDPTSEDYWDELDTRLQRYLPHRYSKGSVNRPRSVVGSGRESSPASRPGEFRLSPERVKAIKDAGKWDNQAARQKMIRRYAEYDKSLGLR
jgi:hypothetical protein